eukprot:3086576-Prymnesium_polylepis.1
MGTTALMNACQAGHETVVQVLLQAGAAVNLVTEKGWTAWSVARKADPQRPWPRTAPATPESTPGQWSRICELLERAGANTAPVKLQ